MFVIGTAGHVDHGKSTLVLALTGIDPDRLQEEKARGMTIDLGFAWTNLSAESGASSLATAQPSLENVGIVDVPGHIDFIKNMLAGVGGIDAVLLVIAADEGVMPQTREHLAIVDLLSVPAGVVALTKIDLVDEPDWLELVQMDVAELLQGTRLADAPVVPVSATTGAGMDLLRQALATTLGKLTPRRNRARPRLPVDRVFTMSGFGAVVTGTLLDGAFQVGDAVEILPEGRPARIRNLQTHKQVIDIARPGSRLAINLSGVSADEVRRGSVVAKPGQLQSTQLIDLHLRLLADVSRPLVHNQRVDFFCGASETPAVVRVLGAEQLAPGEEGWLQVRLERPVVVVSGDHFILRQPSPSATLGGGVVLRPHPRRRWPRFDEAVLAQLRTLANGAPDEILLHLLEQRPFQTGKEALATSELDLEVGEQALADLRVRGLLVSFAAGAEPLLAATETWTQLTAQWRELLAAFHQQSPLRRGMARGEARSRLQASLPTVDLTVRLFNTLVERAREQGWLAADDGYLWLTDHQVRLTIHQQAMVDHLLAVFAHTPFAPPTQQESLRQLGEEAELLESLIEQGLLLRVGGDVLFRPADFDEMVRQVEAFLGERGAITLGETRDLLQTSRKYVQALLEELDARRITRRVGDLRVLRR
jgi:selenocysteine-specific elongation factor